MSFVRMSRNSSFRRSATGRPKKPKKRPEWNDDIHDLEVHKATPEELQRRKEAVQSNNVDLVKADHFKKKISKARSRNKSAEAAKNEKNAFIKELLFNQSQLQEALSASDHVMSVVKDLFGDDPRKFRGLPNVTVAPSKKMDSSLPDGTLIGNPLKLDVLSETMMDKSALNDVDATRQLNSSDGDEEEEEDEDEALNFRPVMDIARFQQYVRAERERDSQLFTPPPKGKKQAADNVWSDAVTPLNHIVSLNDTEKVLRTKAFTEPESEINAPAHSTMQNGDDASQQLHQVLRGRNLPGDLQRPGTSQVQSQEQPVNGQPALDGEAHLQHWQRVLGAMEASVADYERMIGMPVSLGRPQPESVPSCMLAMVDTVNRLMIYLNQTEIQHRAEVTLREQMAEDLTHLRVVIDGLTSDIIATQEQYSKLQYEFVQQKKQHDAEIQAIMVSLKRHNIQVEAIPAAAVVRTDATRPNTGQTVHTNQPGQAAQPPVRHHNISIHSDASLPTNSEPLSARDLGGLLPNTDSRVHNSQDYHLANMRAQLEDVSLSQKTAQAEQGIRNVLPRNGVTMNGYLNNGPVMNGLPHDVSMGGVPVGAAVIPLSISRQPTQDASNLHSSMPPQSSYAPAHPGGSVPCNPAFSTSDRPHTTQASQPVFYSSQQAAHPALPRPALPQAPQSAFQPAVLLSPPRHSNSPRTAEGVQSQQPVSMGRSSSQQPRPALSGNNGYFSSSGDSYSTLPARKDTGPENQSMTQPPVSQPVQPARAAVLPQQAFRQHGTDGSSSMNPNRSMTVPSAGQSSERRDTSQVLDELNRQHVAAQQKLFQIMQDEMSSKQEQQNAHIDDALVSPPISPIPPASESERSVEVVTRPSRNPPQNVKRPNPGAMNRGITISLPRVENMAYSPESPSP